MYLCIKSEFWHFKLLIKEKPKIDKYLSDRFIKNVLNLSTSKRENFLNAQAEHIPLHYHYRKDLSKRQNEFVSAVLEKSQSVFWQNSLRKQFRPLKHSTTKSSLCNIKKVHFSY